MKFWFYSKVCKKQMFIHNSVFLEHHCCFSKFTAQLDVTESRLEKKIVAVFQISGRHISILKKESFSLAASHIICYRIGLLSCFHSGQKPKNLLTMQTSAKLTALKGCPLREGV